MFIGRKSFTTELLTHIIKDIDEIEVQSIYQSSEMEAETVTIMERSLFEERLKRVGLTNTRAGLAKTRNRLDELILSGFYTVCVCVCS